MNLFKKCMGMFSITLDHNGRPKPYPVKSFYNVGLHVVVTLTMSECIQLLTVCFKGMRYINVVLFYFIPCTTSVCLLQDGSFYCLQCVESIAIENGAICGKM